jgi:hypothetical protein
VGGVDAGPETRERRLVAVGRCGRVDVHTEETDGTTFIRCVRGPRMSAPTSV